MRRVTAIDMPLFLCLLVLVGLGIAFIYSASYPKALVSTDSGGDSFFYAGKQIVFALAAGLPMMLLCTLFPLEMFYRHPARKWFFWFTAGLLTLLMIAPIIIHDERHGNYNWLGPIQPSEFLKVGIIVLLSAYLCRQPWKVKTFRGLLAGPAWFLIVPAGLIIAQRDLGTALVVVMATAILLVIAGVKARYIGIPMLGLVLLMSAIVMSGHRMERIEVWLHPEDHPNGKGFQTLHSLIAVGSGGLFGRGFCQSREKWSFLPAAQNDSIVAVIAEELGFVLTVIALFLPFMFLVFRGFSIAHRASDEFGALVASGATVMLATQAFMNIAVSLNVIPMMGVNLPFISAGGSSLIASMMMGGLLLNVSATRAHPTRAGETAPTEQPVTV